MAASSMTFTGCCPAAQPLQLQQHPWTADAPRARPSACSAALRISMLVCLILDTHCGAGALSCIVRHNGSGQVSLCQDKIGQALPARRHDLLVADMSMTAWIPQSCCDHVALSASDVGRLDQTVMARPFDSVLT